VKVQAERISLSRPIFSNAPEAAKQRPTHRLAKVDSAHVMALLFRRAAVTRPSAQDGFVGDRSVDTVGWQAARFLDFLDRRDSVCA